MAAGEDETQPVVFDAFVIPRLGIIGSRESPVNIVRQRLKSGMPANRDDRLETPRRHEPGTRIGWHTVAWPLLQSGPESNVPRLLSDIQVAQQPDQRGKNVARVGEVDRVDLVARVFSRGL